MVKITYKRRTIISGGLNVRRKLATLKLPDDPPTVITDEATITKEVQLKPRPPNRVRK